jgi:hypothetical protein
MVRDEPFKECDEELEVELDVRDLDDIFLINLSGEYRFVELASWLTDANFSIDGLLLVIDEVGLERLLLDVLAFELVDEGELNFSLESSPLLVDSSVGL